MDAGTVQFATGEYLTEQKLNQVVENTEEVYNDLSVITIYGSSNLVTLGSWTAAIDSVTLTTFTDVDQHTAQVQGDLDISGKGTGPLSFTLGSISFEFFRPAEYDYMTIFHWGGGEGILQIMIHTSAMEFFA